MRNGAKVSRPPVTLKDIAKRAGLSIPSISRILNGTQGNYFLKIRLKKLAEEMGYIPNENARQLAWKRKIKKS